MSDTERKDLILNVANFGPIASAKDVAIKPMTVFVGPSNTGKTYLALMLHAMARGIVQHLDDSSENPRAIKIDNLRPSSAQYNALLSEIYNLYNDSGKETSHIDLNSDSISLESRSFIGSIESELDETLADSVQSSIVSFFEEKNLYKLITGDGTSDNISYDDIAVDLQDESGSWMLSLFGSDNSAGCYATPRRDLADLHYSLLFPTDVLLQIMSGNYFINRQLSVLDELQIRHQIEKSHLASYSSIPSTFYFPASRSGILATYRFIVNESIRRQNNIPQISRIVSDFLRQLLSIQDSVQSDQVSSTVASVLENSLMNGVIEVSNSQYGLPELIYSNKKTDIPISRASSMVTELAPIILFIRHFIRVGDLLIIEEPEAHLHPAAQQKVAAALAFLVRSGFRVIITTHSHYMVEQLSTFVRASMLDPEQRRAQLQLGGQLGEEDIYLNEDEVGVYSFLPEFDTGATTVRKVPFSERYGYTPEDHNAAMSDQFNRNMRVMQARAENN